MWIPCTVKKRKGRRIFPRIEIFERQNWTFFQFCGRLSEFHFFKWVLPTTQVGAGTTVLPEAKTTLYESETIVLFCL